MAREFPKNREDHYLPQGYLRGFINPSIPKTESQPLWVFDTQRTAWKKRSTAQIGYERGFYDFVGRQGDRQHAEEAFSQLENAYPPLIEKLRRSGFHEWRDYSELIMRYVQMIRCRSPLFREHFLREWRDKKAARVLGVNGNKITVDSLRLRHFSPGALKEASVQKMLTEMTSGTALLESFVWQLRLADSIEDCFVTSDQPLTVTPDEQNLLFPLCWQACLVGRRNPFSLSLTASTSRERTAIRQLYFDSAIRFVVAPQRLT